MLSVSTDSILDDIKKVIGIDQEDKSFDLDLVLHINSVFSTLTQLGLGPEDGFVITDSSSKWNDFLGLVKDVYSVKQYVYLKVRLAFDPPSTGFGITAIQEQIKELDWRLSVAREERLTNEY